ncbi:MAG: gephyrin-like molybdotransferase Glp [Rhizobiaceae bacterium]
MARSPLLPVEEALARILDGVAPTDIEPCAIDACHGRTLGTDLAALRTQPPFATSAMDGYAVRAADLDPARPLRLIGQSAAGHRFAGALQPGETVRIFTGAPLPEGADTILIQENATVAGDWITPAGREPQGRFIRKAGLDFAQGDVLLAAGTRLGQRQLGLAAAMNHAVLPVRRKPRVAILATGDELVLPGQVPGPDQIVASNNLAVAAAVETAGGEPFLLDIATDDFASLNARIGEARALGADVLVTIGGASVGDHDLVQAALVNEGMQLSFWRIAMRPGKPMLHGALGPMRIVGLPGNPVSSIVCSMIFIQPLVRALLGDPAARADRSVWAVAGEDFPANDERQDYLRAKIVGEQDGLPLVVAHHRQDSSMLATLAASDALVIRPRHAPALARGSRCRMLLLATPNG